MSEPVKPEDGKVRYATVNSRTWGIWLRNKEYRAVDGVLKLPADMAKIFDELAEERPDISQHVRKLQSVEEADALLRAALAAKPPDAARGNVGSGGTIRAPEGGLIKDVKVDIPDGGSHGGLMGRLRGDAQSILAAAKNSSGEVPSEIVLTEDKANPGHTLGSKAT